jgi:UPF0042 nucleotide-binding protein
MNFLVVTGLSGAGKSQAVRTLEDIGYFCIDNIPPDMALRFAEMCATSQSDLKDFAVVLDARSREHFGNFYEVVALLKGRGSWVRMLYLDADDATLLRRYKETRRRHPLSDEPGCDTIEQAIARERELISPLREQADYIVDTSQLSPQKLREQLMAMFLGESDKPLTLSIISFGYKYGLPAEADLIFDLRCLPNPFYVASLKYKTGLDQKVRDYVFSFPQATEMLRHITDFIDFALPHYRAEGKTRLVIGIGCTGGRHRSVVVAEALAAHLSEKDARLSVTHRDIAK